MFIFVLLPLFHRNPDEMVRQMAEEQEMNSSNSHKMKSEQVPQNDSTGSIADQKKDDIIS